MHLRFSSVRHQNNVFYDTVFSFKSQIKVLKEHIIVKRAQNDAYNKHKAELSEGDLLVHVDLRDQQNEIESAYFGNQSFRSLHRVVVLKV